MTCDEVRAHLLEQPVSTFEALAPHLEACPDCRGLADRIRTAEEDIAMDLDDFVNTGDFAAGWSAAVATPAPRRTLPVQGVLIAAAAAAALLLALPAAWVASSGPSLERAERPPAAGLPAVPPPPAGACPVELDDALVKRAVDGQLTQVEQDCLEGDVVDATDLGPDAFRLLLVDAWGRDDHERWERLVREYLDDMEPDAHLLAKVLLHFSERDDLDDARWDAWEEALVDQLDDLPLDQRETVRQQLGVARTRRDSPPAPTPVSADGTTREALVFLKFATTGELYVDGELVGNLAQRHMLPAEPFEAEVRCDGVVVGRGTVDLSELGMVVRLHRVDSFVLTMPQEQIAATCGG